MSIIETISTNHINECLSIADELLGVNYHDKAYFEHTIEQKKGIVITVENKVAGFLLFKITPPEMSKKMYGLDLSESVGHIGSICVHPAYQKRGYASLLVQEVISILGRDYSSIYTLAWEYSGNVNLEKILVKYDFKKMNFLESIWKKECENNEFNCPVKENRCICSGIVYCLNTK